MVAEPLSSPDSERAPPSGAAAETDPGPVAWHLLDARDVCQRLDTDPDRGLSPDEVRARLARHGSNALVEREQRRLLSLLWDQVGSALILLLVVAAGVSAALGDVEDAIAIAAILVLNAALGFFQEYRAEQALTLLKRLAVPHVVVRRGHRVVEASARDLVPGDLVLLEAGDRVPADGRILSSANLRIEESALTGESQPVDKNPARMTDVGATIADRRNMAYMGTTVVYGRGEIVVTEHGDGHRAGAGRDPHPRGRAAGDAAAATARHARLAAGDAGARAGRRAVRPRYRPRRAASRSSS